MRMRHRAELRAQRGESGPLVLLGLARRHATRLLRQARGRSRGLADLSQRSRLLRLPGWQTARLGGQPRRSRGVRRRWRRIGRGVRRRSRVRVWVWGRVGSGFGTWGRRRPTARAAGRSVGSGSTATGGGPARAPGPVRRSSRSEWAAGSYGPGRAQTVRFAHSGRQRPCGADRPGWIGACRVLVTADCDGAGSGWRERRAGGESRSTDQHRDRETGRDGPPDQRTGYGTSE
jgi:hypothetical protein